MKIGSFRAWLKRRYGDKPFKKDGKISKVFVKSHMSKWSLIIKRKAIFFLNSN